MNKKTKATLSIAILGCIIGILAGRFIINYYYLPPSEIPTEQELDDDRPSAESLGMSLEDKETTINSELQGDLDRIQEEMDKATSEYIDQQEAAQEEAKKAEEKKKAEEEAKRKTQEAVKEVEEAKKEESSESVPDSGETQGDPIPTPEVDTGEADDYTEDDYIPGTPDPDFVDPYAGDPNVISGTLDFGNPSQHINQSLEDYVPQQDMSGWEF